MQTSSIISKHGNPFLWRLGASAIALIFIDFLIWTGFGSLSFALTLGVLGGLGIWGLRVDRTLRDLVVSSTILGAGVLPVAIDLTALSAALGLCLTAISVARLSSTSGRVRGLILTLVATLPLTVWAFRRRVELRGKGCAGFLREWGLAGGCVAGFGLLFLAANPVFEAWVHDVMTFNLNLDLDVGRVLFWTGLAMIVWPLSQLSLTSFSPIFLAPPQVETRSLRNALIALNALFALQTVTDFAILSGGASLPEGMSMGEYVHRGAYPLLATALLAGAFAVVVCLQKKQTPTVKRALIAWICQTLLLVLASAQRLQFYVADFGLTHLRLWAAGWMLVTGIGLGLLLWSIWRDRPVGEFLHRAAMLALLSLYGASFVNGPQVIATHNVARLEAGQSFDRNYTCNLGSKAIVALKTTPVCRFLRPPKINGWRDWSLREAVILRKVQNARVTRSDARATTSRIVR